MDFKKLQARLAVLFSHEYIADPSGVCQVCEGKPESIVHFERDETGRHLIPIKGNQEGD